MLKYPEITFNQIILHWLITVEENQGLYINIFNNLHFALVIVKQQLLNTSKMYLKKISLFNYKNFQVQNLTER
jgi:hypothetical protein